MLINTKEVIKYGNKKYVVFVDSETDREEFIESDSPEDEYNFY